jgi:hypothetical protein
MIPSGKDTHIFTGVMDMDTEARYFAGGNYRYLLNARTTINTQGSFGALEDVMGNVLVTNPYLFNGRNKVIGSCEDIAGQSCIYFVWNEFGYHGIYRWFANRVGFLDGVIETIYQVRFPNLYNVDTNPNPLSFDENKLITGVNLVGDLLYWTDYNREPKEINIVRANNTNKKLSFNFYIDTADLTVATTYNFSLFIENTLGPVYGAAIVSSQLTLELRIKDIVAQLNADPQFANYLTCVNKNQYIEFTCANVGNYYLTAFNTPGNPCIVLPENHYPDYISGTAASFPPLTEDVLKRVKYPAFCAPEGQYTYSGQLYIAEALSDNFASASIQWIYDFKGRYDNTNQQAFYEISGQPWPSPPSAYNYSLIVADGGINQYNYIFNWLSNNYFSISPLPAYNLPNNTIVSFDLGGGSQTTPQVTAFSFWGGFSSEVNDTNNYITLGPATPFKKYGINTFGPTAYISTPTPQALFINYTATISAVLTGPSSKIEIGLYEFDPFFNAVTLIHSIATFTTGTVATTINQGFNFTTTANKLYQVKYIFTLAHDSQTYTSEVKSVSISGVKTTVANGYYDLGNIWQQPFLFRSKYYYNDNEQSVLSAYSKLPLPQSTVVDSIKIDYNDFWLNNIPYLSTLKYIYLYVSPDNGLTWNEWQRIERWRFAPMMNRIDSYDNKEILTTISAEEALLEYHAVPLKSKTQEYIDDRIWDGAIVEGYDAINVDVIATVQYRNITTDAAYNNVPYLSVAGFRYGYEGYVGIVYYDNADRKSGVSIISENKVMVPYLSQGLGTTNIYTTAVSPYLNIAINNNPPDWATKYQIVITKDLSAIKTLVWIPTFIQKVDVNFVATTTNPRYWELDLSNIPYYIEHADLGTQISYTFQKGDRLRMLAYPSGIVVAQNYDTEILAAQSNKIYVRYDSSFPWEQGPSQVRGLQTYVEIYTGPIESNAENITFYEVGECHEIAFDANNNKYHKAPLQDQDLATNTPALLDIYNGGIYYRKRQSYYYSGNGTTFYAGVPVMIWSGTINDFIAVDTDGFGRTNIISDIGQQYRYSTFRFSDQYQEVLNGLSANQPLNFMQMNLNYGDLNKMQVVNNDVLKLIFGNSYQVSIYVNQGVIRQAQGQSPLISVSDQVAGNSHVIQRTLGTLNAESVLVNDEGDMFGYDENEGVIWIASGNGLLQISDRGMKSVFKQYSNQRKATGGISETPTVYDLYHDEYIITLGDMNGFTGVTIAYNKQKQGWTSYYSFVPEYYGRVRDYVVSFKDGQLWKHDANTLAKNFYGTQYTRQLKFISNKDFPKVKQYKAIAVTGIGKNDAPSIFIPPYEGVPTGMLSSLSARFFETLEGIQYANLQKDKLSPGFGGNQLQALVNGRNLKGQTIEITLENTDITKSSIYSTDVVYFYSENS